MSVTSYLPFIVCGALALVSYVWITKKRARAEKEAGPAWRKFFEHLGYKYADLLDAPVEAQVGRVLATYSRPGSNKQHMIREFHGAHLHWKQKTRQTKRRWSSSMSWSLTLRGPPRVVWQIAEKSLGGAGKAVKEAFSNVSRTWAPTYALRIKTGDAELDRRFRIYGEQPDEVVKVLATPGLKQMLLDTAEVDLLIGEEGVSLSDPQQKNIHAALGGTLGMMANAGDVTKYVDMLAAIHDRVAELLVSVAQASR